MAEMCSTNSGKSTLNFQLIVSTLCQDWTEITLQYNKSERNTLLDAYQDISVDVSRHFHIAQVHSRLHQLSGEQCQFQCNHSTVCIFYVLPEKKNNTFLTSTQSRDRFKESTSCSAIASSNFPCCWYSSPRTLQQLAISLNSPLDFALAFTFNSSKERKKVTLLLPMPLYEFSYLEHL